MNILFITDLYPVKSDEKTTPRTLLAFVEEWGKMGHNVDVLKPNFILNSFLRKKPFYKSGQYGDVFNINYWTPFWFDVKRNFNGNSRLGTLAQLNKHNYNIVVAHMPSGILFADKLGLPFVAGIHNSDIEVLTNPLYKIHFKPRLEKALRNARAIACRSFVLQDKLLKLYPEFENKVFVAPSGVDEKAIKQLGSEAARLLDGKPIRHETDLDVKMQRCKEVKSNTELGKYAQPTEICNVNFVEEIDQNLSKRNEKHSADTNFSRFTSHISLSSDMNHSLLTTHHSPIKVLTCAHFKKRKNIDKVIKACKGLECFELTVIGDGKERKKLEKIDKNVIFTGRLPHDEVLAKMRNSDIFVLPSVGETFGMVYLEAMASGCITVCTKGDGIDGIIKDRENGFLTEPNPESIKETLLNIKNLTKEELNSLYTNSFNTIQHYTSTLCAERYLQQILKIM